MSRSGDAEPAIVGGARANARAVAELARARARDLVEPFLARIRDGQGASVAVHGFRGSGRTTLLHTVAVLASEAGLTVARVRASDLERGTPLALATQLFEPLRRSVSEAETAPTLAGSDGVACCRWLARRTALTGGGLALIVDDAHVADDASLRVLALLQADLERLPLLLVLSSARGEWPRAHRVLSRLHEIADLCHSPPPLSAHELIALLVAEWPESTAELADTVGAAAGGNARLTADLLASLREQDRPLDASAVDNALEAPSERTTAWIAGRLARLGPNAGAVATATAVLERAARLGEVAALCGLDRADVAGAADELSRAGILTAGEPLAYTAPMMRAGALALLAPLERRSAHTAAARILLEVGAAPEAIAAQLLGSGPLGDPRVPELLRAEAAACAPASPGRAQALLSRALSEQPTASVRAELLRDLARLERRIGDPRAGDRLAESRRLHPEAAFRHRTAIDEALLRLDAGECRASAMVIADAVTAEVTPLRGRLGADLRAVYVCAASRIPELRASVIGLRAAVLADADGEARGLQRAAVAHLLLLDRLRGIPNAETEGLDELAWGEGALLDPALPALAIPALCWAMLIGDGAERAIEVIRHVLSGRLADSARGVGLRAAALCLRAWAYLVRGDLQRAESDAVAALGGPFGPPFAFVWSSLAVLAACALECGEPGRAGEMVSLLRCAPMDGTAREPLVHIAEARIALAERRPEVALAAATQAADRLAGMGVVTLGPIQSWRAPAALAELMAGRQRQAAARAADALAIARAAGAPAAVIRDLHVAGLCAGVPDGLPALEEAVLLADSSPLRLEGIYALVGFGTALRRAGQRESARTVLRRALQRGREAGAEQLANLAQAELAAAGARERRRALTGVGSLTPSQLRVVEMAAGGLTTRQMADELVVSPKTVEFHLGHAYRKLGVRSRAELPGLLDGHGAAQR